LISFGKNHFYPIESVYGVIEIKTTLRKSDIKKTYDDYQKLKKLEFLEEKYTYFSDDLDGELKKEDGAIAYTAETIRPFYMLFSFDSSSKKPDIISKRVSEII
jgi:hypothetical protein